MDNKTSYAQRYNATVLRNIRIKCVERETSIPKIEKALGYGNGSISGWSKAKRLAPMDRIEAVARLLECRVSDLTTDEDAKSPAPDEGEADDTAEFNRILSVLGPDQRKQLLDFGHALVIVYEAQGSGSKSP